MLLLVSLIDLGDSKSHLQGEQAMFPSGRIVDEMSLVTEWTAMFDLPPKLIPVIFRGFTTFS